MHSFIFSVYVLGKCGGMWGLTCHIHWLLLALVVLGVHIGCQGIIEPSRPVQVGQCFTYCTIYPSLPYIFTFEALLCVVRNVLWESLQVVFQSSLLLYIFLNEDVLSCTLQHTLKECLSYFTFPKDFTPIPFGYLLPASILK